MDKSINRRQFGRLCAGLAATAAVLPVTQVRAEELPHLDPNAAQAKALGYHVDASKVDKTKFPNYVAGSHCATCQLYEGKAGDQYGKCGIFVGQLVHSKGWCTAWAKKVG